MKPAIPVEALFPTPAQRLLRIAASCPSCGTRPALRISTEIAAAAGDQPPGARVGTYQCQRRGCKQIYDLTARAYQNAS